MTEIKGIYKTTVQRDNNGQFSGSEYGEKKLRSMKLTDHAWDTLEVLARERGVTRTDIIEEFTRQKNKVNKRAIILNAIDAFIKLKEDSFGNNPMQKGKEFSMNARTWDVFREFLKFVSLKY